MESDCLTDLDVAESIVNAVAIYKRLRSRSLLHAGTLEYLYVIQSTNLEGLYAPRLHPHHLPHLR